VWNIAPVQTGELFTPVPSRANRLGVRPRHGPNKKGPGSRGLLFSRLWCCAKFRFLRFIVPKLR
jgi:hypothetical protein